MKTVIGLFDTLEHAQAAQQALTANQVDENQISVVTKSPAARGHSSEAAEGAEVGAATGAVAGGTAALLASLGAFAIPGIGPVLGLGALIATLTGIGVGAAAGGAIGGLIGLGIPAHEAEVYAEGIKRGGTLISVQASEADAERIAGLLSQHHAVNIEERSAQWKAGGWQSTHAPIRNWATEAKAVAALQAGNIGGPTAASVGHGIHLGDVANAGASIGSIGVGLGEGIGDMAGARRYNARIYNPAE